MGDGVNDCRRDTRTDLYYCIPAHNCSGALLFTQSGIVAEHNLIRQEGGWRGTGRGGDKVGLDYIRLYNLIPSLSRTDTVRGGACRGNLTESGEAETESDQPCTSALLHPGHVAQAGLPVIP